MSQAAVPDAGLATGATVEPRLIAEFSDYDGFLGALRKRGQELKLAISSEENTEIAGLSERYLQKILGSRPVKRIGVKSMGAIFGVLAIKCLVVEDEEALQRLRMLAEKYGKALKLRNPALVRANATHIVLTRRFLQKIGRSGGLARAERLTPQERAASARKAAMARWSAAASRARSSVSDRRGETEMPFPTDGNNHSLFPFGNKPSPTTIKVNQIGDQPSGLLNGNSKPMRTEPTRQPMGDRFLTHSPRPGLTRGGGGKVGDTRLPGGYR